MVSGGVRRAAVAGSWYPGTSERIAAEVESYLSAVPSPELPGRLVGLISPHAGLRYSGPVAAFGYALLRGRRVGTVVLVGPSHRMAFRGSAAFARGSFETPLGRIPIDEGLAASLTASGQWVSDDAEPHLQEHSLELQLPFLQHLVPELRIVPVVMGEQTRKSVEGLAAALEAAATGHDVLLVASSDLSHFNPAPVAHSLDAEVIGDVERYAPEELMARLEAQPDHACGGGPIVAVMKAARALGANRAAVLRYGDSGDVGERDKSQVVGYLSAALSAA
jgi:AmmeMemoRadiSam system protein B